MIFTVTAKGHKLISAKHKSTLEITKENYLTEKGDCIIGISSNFSASEFPDWLKEYLKNENKIIIEIECENLKDKIIAMGSKYLTFKDNKSFVIRKSNYIDDRTVAIKANKAARDIDRRIIDLLKLEKEIKIIFKIFK
ncbi:MAG: DUF371 domain-containing protein [Nanopusillaceae archaeon]